MGAAGRDPPTGNYLGCDLVRIPKCRTEQFKSLYGRTSFPKRLRRKESRAALWEFILPLTSTANTDMTSIGLTRTMYWWIVFQDCLYTNLLRQSTLRTPTLPSTSWPQLTRQSLCGNALSLRIRDTT